MNTFLLILSTLFTYANEQYVEGNYAQAATAYEQCLTDTTQQAFLTDESRAEVYYNLGNARFKQGELAQSILAYERCLRLEPRHKDAQYNLEFAQSKIIDNIADNRAFFLITWINSVINLMTARSWLHFSIICLIITLLCAFIFAFGKTIALRKTAFIIAVATVILTVTTGVNSFSRYQIETQHRDAIVTQGIVNAKSSPDRSGTDLFTLHEGTKVYIQETLGEWCNIRVGNNEGWVSRQHIEAI